MRKPWGAPLLDVGRRLLKREGDAGLLVATLEQPKAEAYRRLQARAAELPLAAAADPAAADRLDAGLAKLKRLLDWAAVTDTMYRPNRPSDDVLRAELRRLLRPQPAGASGGG